MPATPSATYFASLIAPVAAAYSPGRTESPVTTQAFTRIAVDMLGFAAEVLGQVPVSVQILSAGMRSVVLRVGVEQPVAASAGARTAVLKYFRRRDSAGNSGGFGYLREKHGLDAFGELTPGRYPRLLAASDERRCLLLEDLSPAQTCADLLRSGPAGSARALEACRELWTAVLASPAQRRVSDKFARALGSADPGAARPGSLTSPRLALAGLEKLVMSGALPARELAGARAQVEALIYAEPESCLLTSGDFSPLNVVPGADGTRGMDAEGTAWHHPALLLAEVLLGFPSTPGPPLTEYVSRGELEGTALALAQVLDPGVRTVAELTARPELQAALLAVRAICAEQGA